MMYEREQQELAEKLKPMPKEIAHKVISAMGSFASGFLSGYEAAKAEAETQDQGA